MEMELINNAMSTGVKSPLDLLYSHVSTAGPSVNDDCRETGGGKRHTSVGLYGALSTCGTVIFGWPLVRFKLVLCLLCCAHMVPTHQGFFTHFEMHLCLL